MIVALCLSMLVSQILFPMGKDKQEPTSKVIVTNERGLGLKTTDQGTDKDTNDTSSFRRQLSEDYKRVSRNFSLVVLLTIVIGLMLYEMGFRVLLLFGGKGEKQKLQRYSPTHDSDDELTLKFEFSTEPVGLVYFAPFLKENFSGQENYFDFLVTDYYRFLEFATIMPISIIVSGILGMVYYVLFSIRNSCWYDPLALGLLFLVLFVSSILFLLKVTPSIFESYKKAVKDLIQGVSDMMSKGLVK